jgi:hypothetical protein
MPAVALHQRGRHIHCALAQRQIVTFCTLGLTQYATKKKVPLAHLGILPILFALRRDCVDTNRCGDDATCAV